MKIAYLVAGAGGMYCGSCMRDNRLAAELIKQKRDVVLLPLYMPIRTDEPDVSEGRVYYGGINVFLQQKSAIFRHAPSVLDKVFDSPALLRGVGRLASGTRPENLGALTVSVLKGEQGEQRKELKKLVSALREMSPDVIHLPNLMFLGIARALRSELQATIVCSLAGEDIFLDALSEPFKLQSFDLIRQLQNCADVFIAPSQYYARHCAEHFQIDSDKIELASMGICVDDFSALADPLDDPFTIGYLARICPEKGLAELCEAFASLRRAGRDCRLRIAGYLGKADEPYWEHIRSELKRLEVWDMVEYVGEVSREEKIDFLRSLNVFSVPAAYPEAKGFYVLEALASGVPVVQPTHGSFPELVEATGGGLLFEPGNREALVRALAELMDNPSRRRGFAENGRTSVHELYSAQRMADATWAIYESCVGRKMEAKSNTASEPKLEEP